MYLEILRKFLCGSEKRDLSVRKCPQNDLKKVEHLRTFAMGTFAAPYCIFLEDEEKPTRRWKTEEEETTQWREKSNGPGAATG